MRGHEECNSTVLVLMMERSGVFLLFFLKDEGYVKYGREVGGGLSLRIKVDWMMRSGSRSQMRVQQNVKQIQLKKSFVNFT